MPELLTPEEAGAYLRLSPRSVITLAKRDDDKRLPGTKMANEWRFLKDDVVEYVYRIFGREGSKE